MRDYTQTPSSLQPLLLSSMAAACVAVIADNNRLLYLRTADCPDPLFYHFKAHAALDVIEDKLSKRRRAGAHSTVAAGPTQQQHQSWEPYLGLLYPMEDHRVYGYVTNTNVKVSEIFH